MILEQKLPFTTLRLRAERMGEDQCVLLTGGEKPHVGSVVLAVPRPSLTGDGTDSCTSSVLNCTGHKDEVLCRMVAEELCTRTGRTVVCTGGVHMDRATGEQISAVVEGTKALLETAAKNI